MREVTSRDLTLALLETNSVFLEEEKKVLASGRRSNLYFNVGDLIISYPLYKELVVEAMIQTWKKLEVHPDRMVGVPEGMNMLTSSIGDKLSIGQLRIRENQQEHDDQRSVEGYYTPFMTVGINEDVVSTGGSADRRVIKPLEGADLVPVAMVGLIDRQCGAKSLLSKLNVEYRSFTTTTEIATTLIAEGGLSDNKLRLLKGELAEINPSK